jgi:glycine oxidase
MSQPDFEFLMIGGGVIGLALARELSRHSDRVAVLDRGPVGGEASWAGAGILPPANRETAHHALDHLRGLSYELHAQWADELRSQTGIDVGYRRCGGLYVAGSVGEVAALRGMAEICGEEGIAVQRVELADLARLEPALIPAVENRRIRACYLLPEEAQVRNPRLLRALAAACRQQGVQLLQHTEVRDLQIFDGSIQLETSAGPLCGRNVCITSGAWTYQLLKKLQIETGILPIRGQMVMFASDRPVLSRIVNEGSRYLVPRDDGRLLAGSTEEEVGFDKQTTADAIADLTAFACGLVPALKTARIERAWAGLRPGSFDGFPYIGRVPRYDNVYVAAGHFRTGLYLSTGTAAVMSQLMRGETPSVNLAPFSLLRH